MSHSRRALSCSSRRDKEPFPQRCPVRGRAHPRAHTGHCYRGGEGGDVPSRSPLFQISRAAVQWTSQAAAGVEGSQRPGCPLGVGGWGGVGVLAPRVMKAGGEIPSGGGRGYKAETSLVPSPLSGRGSGQSVWGEGSSHTLVCIYLHFIGDSLDPSYLGLGGLVSEDWGQGLGRWGAGASWPWEAPSLDPGPWARGGAVAPGGAPPLQRIPRDPVRSLNRPPTPSSVRPDAA